MTETIEKREFSAEVGRLLDLVVHSLYSEREIFLRELVANAADATDRRRFEAQTHPGYALPEDAAIRITPDKAARTLTISDCGIGMTREDLISHLGTIARSGTRAFGQSLADSKPEDRPNLIGQFGVGFYSAFMVADRVDVISRHAGSEEAFLWSSEGRGDYSIAPAERAAPGTDIILSIKSDADEYLDPFRLQTIIRKWADHVALPVKLISENGEETVNEGTALWRKAKSDVTEDAYKDFYRHLGHSFDEPWATLHWRAEGAIDFSALLFIPTMKPFGFAEESRESKLHLHVKRMFITDKAELLPPWLRFVQGVVDTEDLPLNVSREMLQATPVLARIKKAVTNRVITELKTRAKDAESYEKFWDVFGSIVKEGLYDDFEHKSDVAAIARFRSTHGEGWVSLSDYVSRMKDGQKAIYLLAGDDLTALRSSPQLEGFRARGIEVLLLSDAVDSFWPERFGEFEGKKLVFVAQASADLAEIPPLEAQSEAADVSALASAIKTALGNAVSEVRASDRLVASAVVLASAAHGPDLQMQRLLRRSGRAMELPPVLEINPRHALIIDLSARAAAGENITDAAETLFDLARVQDGEAPRDPAAFARRVTAALGAK
jgi:molecular chaperone HtpG